MSSYHLVGVGGSGMSALAQVLAGRGNKVSGSDRNYDLGINLPLFEALLADGLKLFAQDGSGVKPYLEAVVVSSAIEESISDVARAHQFNIPIRKRAEILADLLNEGQGIAVAGTSGKSTVTGMIGHILTKAGADPTIINGGGMKNFQLKGRPNNMRLGSSDLIVIESDESDGSIVNYYPVLSVITNISKDHKDIPELRNLFRVFADQTAEKIAINADCPNIASLNLAEGRTVTFSLQTDSLYKAHSLRLEEFGSSFKCRDRLFHLQVPGLHNIYNALAAIAIADYLEIPEDCIQEALEGFRGISRRFDLVGEVEGIRVIDDFAHNPDKIAATLNTCKRLQSRLIIVFQPHGFGPTRFLKEELVDSLVLGISEQDIVFLPEIFYAGGTVSRDISSQELVQAISARGRKARYAKNKEAIIKPLVEESRPGDTILVMGARDNTLTLFCRKILQMLGEKFKKYAIL